MQIKMPFPQKLQLSALLQPPGSMVTIQSPSPRCSFANILLGLLLWSNLTLPFPWDKHHPAQIQYSPSSLPRRTGLFQMTARMWKINWRTGTPMFREDKTRRSLTRSALNKFKTDIYTASWPPIEKGPSWKSWHQISEVCFTTKFPWRKLTLQTSFSPYSS